MKEFRSKCHGAEAFFRKGHDEELGGEEHDYYLVCSQCKKCCDVEPHGDNKRVA